MCKISEVHVDVSMGDPVYMGDFFIDPGFVIKQEPGIEALCTSASVPIPQRRFNDSPQRRFNESSEYRDFPFEYNPDLLNSSSPSISHEPGIEMSTGLPVSESSMWSKVEPRSDTFKMDEEDIFQVDKADLIQGPTLAELNANDDTLLGDFNFDDLLLPEESSYFISVPSVTMNQNDMAMPIVHVTDSHMTSQSHLSVNSSFAASSFPPAGLGFLKDSFNSSSSVPSSPLDLYLQNAVSALSPSSHSQHSSSSSLLQQPSESTPPSSSISPLQMKHSTLHELLLKKESFSSTDRLHTLLGKSVPGPTSPVMSAVSPTSPRVHNARSSRTSSSRLSSSAPTHLGLDQIWQRREPRKHLLSTGSLAEAGSTSSISTGGVLSPESHDFSQDEGSDTEDESDHYEFEDVSTDAGTSGFMFRYLVLGI